MSGFALVPGSTATENDKLWGLLSHASAFVFPFVGAIIVILFANDKPFVRYHAIQSLLFQITALVIGGATCGLGLILYLLPLWGAMQAWKGEWEGYPILKDFGKPTA